MSRQYDNNLVNNSELLDLSEAKFSDITEKNEYNELDQNMEDLEKSNNFAYDDLKKVKRVPKLYESQAQYEFGKQERIDVYIKNYLNKFEMSKTLKAFEQELYEALSKEVININEIDMVPEVYIESEIIQEEIGNIQKELDDAKIYAEKANSLLFTLKSQKENEKIKHRRVQQEKKKLMKEIEKIQSIFEEDKKTYKELKTKYWSVTHSTLNKESEQTTLKASHTALKEQHEKLKKTLEDATNQRESKFLFYTKV